MEYKKFYLAARRYAKHRIDRGGLMTDWSYAQCQQGIKPKVKNRSGTKWVEAVC